MLSVCNDPVGFCAHSEKEARGGRGFGGVCAKDSGTEHVVWHLGGLSGDNS